MPNLHTVYDFRDATMHPTFLLPLSFALIGAYILAYSLGYTTYYVRQLLRFKSKQQAIFIGSVFIIAGTFLSVLVYNQQNGDFNRLRKIYNGGKYLEVHGRISNYRPSKSYMKEKEQFDVDSVHFDVWDDETSRYGYNKTHFSGTVIRPNLYVKIMYVYDGRRNVILKLEAE